ncbi:chromate efflux transporter [Marinomonas dokdonensis]|uniref:chromate efflux transporter n=1 Tax=Marinomonas dokdonensis TaxID=328224 RepID=UPI0040556FDE
MFSIFKTFFLLGCYSFGGPAAHIGYFREHFVTKKSWLSDQEFAQYVALSQFLPGPGSSQVGFAIGYKRGGLAGACAAFLGFTLPSVLALLVFASLGAQFVGTDSYQAIIHGLKLLAVVVVADAALGMYRNFCQSKLTAGLCVLTALVLLCVPSVTSQILVLVFAALIGAFTLSEPQKIVEGRFKASTFPLVLFLVLLLALPILPVQWPLLHIFNDFFQAGSLVFGGGHVVLPLLQSLVGEQLGQDAFLAGYAAAQAVPGPMFTLATYFGYVISDTPVLGALVATLAVFLPGFLLLLGVLKNWQSLANKPKVAGALRGVNAAVVGLLIAALYQPVFSSAVISAMDMALVLVGLFLLKQMKLSVLWVILFFVLFSLFL